MTFEIKKCRGCEQEKNHTEYYGSGSLCKICFIKRKNNRIKNIANWLKQFKRNCSCEMCGYSKETHSNFTYKALDFHHAQDNKEFGIGKSQSSGVSIKTLKKEIDKCVVLCSRCHIEIHNK